MTRRRANLGPMRSALIAASAGLALTVPATVAAPPADARVLVVGDADGEVTVLDAVSHVPAARLALPAGPASVVVSRDGRRAHAAIGATVLALDLDAPSVVQRRPDGSVADLADAIAARAGVEAQVRGLAASPGGGSVLAAAGRSLVVLDARTLRVLRRIGLRGDAAGAPGLSPSGASAAVPLAGGRVAVVDVGRGRLARRVAVPGAAGAAVDGGGRIWVAGRRARLYLVRAGERKREKRSIRLPRGVGGAVALQPGGARLAIGAAGPAGRMAVVDLATRRVRSAPAGTGPGAPAWASDLSRLYVADAGAGTLSLLNPAPRRFGRVELGGRPAAVAFQPGVARMVGTEAPDTLRGSRLRDVLEGLGGDDVLQGGRENDVIRGGPGADRLGGGAYDDRLEGGAGPDLLSANAGNDRLEGGADPDVFDGGTGNDRLDGGDGDDRMDGGDGDDRIFGGPGADEIVERGFGNDRRLYGGPGNDLVRGGRGSDRKIKGGDGDDRLFGESGTENITGGDGADHVDGGRARDLLYGNNGDDTVRGDSGDDTMEGGFGRDTLDGGSGEDEIAGGPGHDVIVAGPDQDVAEGGDGDDVIRAADHNADLVDCGPGNDTAIVEDVGGGRPRDTLVGCETVTFGPPESATDTEPVSIVRGTRGNDLLRGTPGDDSMFGKAGKDRMFGGAGDDYVDGEWGKDELHGGPGDDILAGRSNDDRIYGDHGNDRVTGDRGADVIDGGPGDDELFGNLGPDVVKGGRGRDRINVVRGEIDRVDCGLGRDIVFADPHDRVSRSCETVRR